MKKMYKGILLVLCAILMVVVSVMGTLAYLQMQTETVTNTMAVGKVTITLDEAKVNVYGVKEDDTRIIAGNDADGNPVGNTYKLIPNHSYVKDPTVHVQAESEACFVFVKVENGIADIEAETNTIADQMKNNGWMPLPDVDNVYYISVNKDEAKAGKELPVFASFKISSAATNETLSNYNNAKITVKAYAIQADGFADANAAWTAAQFS